MNGFDNSNYNIFKPQILIPSVATALGIAGLYIGLTDIKVNFVHDYILSEWNKLLLLFSAFTIEPLFKLVDWSLFNMFEFELELSDFYREVFVILSFYCFNSIRISIQRKRWGNVFQSIFLLAVLTIVSSLDISADVLKGNRFALAMFSFFIYDLLQGIYDSVFHSPADQTKFETFKWYFKVQIIWSFLFAISCNLVVIFFSKIGLVGGDVISFIMLIALLSLRNIFLGVWQVVTNNQSFKDYFMTYGTARMGVYLATTLFYAFTFVLTGAGLNYYIVLDSAGI